MIRVLSRKLCTALNITHAPTSKNISLVYPAFNEITSTTYNTDDGYRVLVDVCHETMLQNLIFQTHFCFYLE